MPPFPDLYTEIQVRRFRRIYYGQPLMPNNQDRVREVGTFGMPLPQVLDLHAYEDLEQVVDMKRLFDLYHERRRRGGNPNYRIQAWEDLYPYERGFHPGEWRRQMRRENPRYDNMIGYLRNKRRRMERLAMNNPY